MNSFIDRFPKFVSILGTASLLLSISYEYGYFFAIDFSLIRLLKWPDYFRGALYWLPFSFLPLVAAIYWDLGNRIYVEKREAILGKKISLLQKVNHFVMRNMIAIMFYSGIVAFGISAVFATGRSAESALMIVVWSLSMVAVKIWGENSDTLVELANNKEFSVSAIVQAIFVVFSLPFMLGYYHARIDLYDNEIPLTLSTNPEVKGSLLKSIELGFLFRKQLEDAITFYDYDRNALLTYKIPPIPKESRICRFSGYFCKTNPLNATDQP